MESFLKLSTKAKVVIVGFLMLWSWFSFTTINNQMKTETTYRELLTVKEFEFQKQIQELNNQNHCLMTTIEAFNLENKKGENNGN